MLSLEQGTRRPMTGGAKPVVGWLDAAIRRVSPIRTCTKYILPLFSPSILPLADTERHRDTETSTVRSLQ